MISKEERSCAATMLQEENFLLQVLNSIVRELKKVSTLYIDYNQVQFYSGDQYKGEESLMAYFQSMLLGEKEIEGNEELIYGLYLLILSGIRFEELNGHHFDLELVSKMLKEKFAFFGGSVDESMSLIEIAGKIKYERDNLPPSKVIYQKIDGATRTRGEFIMEREIPGELLDHRSALIKNLKEVSDAKTCLKLFEELSSSLLKSTNANIVLFSGHRTFLKSNQPVNLENFFSYVYMDEKSIVLPPDFKTPLELKKYINEGFRGSVERQFRGGYNPLLPAIAINEDNRPDHIKACLKSLMKCNANVFSKVNAVDLRCISSTSNETFTEKQLNLLFNYVDIYVDIVEYALMKGIELPIINL